jgi:hypothetical protein
MGYVGGAEGRISMAVENFGNGMVITGDDIGVYRLLSLRSMLKMEISGLTRRGASASSIIRSETGLTGSKEVLLRKYEAWLKDRNFLK